MAAWIALALLAAVPGRAQQVPPAPAPAPAPEVAPAFGDPLAIGEADLRMTVPVTIDGSGAWPFVIDTGAERTVLSRELAERLKLKPGRNVRVVTMAGFAAAPTAQVPALSVSTLRPPAIEAPLFARRHMGAIGMLGLDALQGHAVRIDFDRDSMAVRPSRRRRATASPDEIVITAKSLYGQLIVTNARWRGKRIAVVLDTGSRVTIANRALLHAATTPPPSLGALSIFAVTGDVLIAEGYEMDGIEIGSVTLNNVAVAVADAAPFRKFGLEDTPALLLGMETLRLFRRVEIDFPGRTIRLTLPRSGRTGSRIAG